MIFTLAQMVIITACIFVLYWVAERNIGTTFYQVKLGIFSACLFLAGWASVCVTTAYAFITWLTPWAHAVTSV